MKFQLVKWKLIIIVKFLKFKIDRFWLERWRWWRIYIYICHGDDEDEPSQINNVIIHIKDYKKFPNGYIYDQNDLNKCSSKKNKKYTYIIIKIKNSLFNGIFKYRFDLSKKSILEFGESGDIVYIDNNNVGVLQVKQ